MSVELVVDVDDVGGMVCVLSERRYIVAEWASRETFHAPSVGRLSRCYKRQTASQGHFGTMENSLASWYNSTLPS